MKENGVLFEVVEVVEVVEAVVLTFRLVFCSFILLFRRCQSRTFVDRGTHENVVRKKNAFGQTGRRHVEQSGTPPPSS